MAAEEQIKSLGNKHVADAVAAGKLRALKTAEKDAQLEVIVRGTADPNSVGSDAKAAH